MKELIKSVLYEKEEINKELSLIVKTCVSLTLSVKSSQTLFKYMIPAIYSNWERFIKNSVRFYIIYLNKKRLKHTELGFDILTIIIDQKHLFEKNFTDFNNKKEMISSVNDIFKAPIIPEDRPKTSTLNFKETNKILLRYKIKELELKKEHEKKLNELIHYRSHIAHGDNLKKLFTLEDIIGYVNLIEYLMDTFVLNLTNEKYN